MFHLPHRTNGANGVPETGILARAEAAVQGILQILDSACQAKTDSEAGKNGGFSIGFPSVVGYGMTPERKTTEGWEYGDDPGRP
jgi:hypothetical protein